MFFFAFVFLAPLSNFVDLVELGLSVALDLLPLYPLQALRGGNRLHQNGVLVPIARSHLLATKSPNILVFRCLFALATTALTLAVVVAFLIGGRVDARGPRFRALAGAAGPAGLALALAADAGAVV